MPSWAVLSTLDSWQQFERVVTLDRRDVGGGEAVIRDALVDFGTVAEREIRAVHDLRNRHHLKQRRDLSRRVALRQLVIELLELGHGSVRQMRGLALLRQADEAAGEERQRAARMRPDPADVGKPG